jgi:hypothetical protein
MNWVKQRMMVVLVGVLSDLGLIQNSSSDQESDGIFVRESLVVDLIDLSHSHERIELGTMSLTLVDSELERRVGARSVGSTGMIPLTHHLN